MSRKNHQMVNGRLLQTDKKFSALKEKQKIKIAEWFYEAYRKCYVDSGKILGKKEFFKEEAMKVRTAQKNSQANASAKENYQEALNVLRHFAGTFRLRRMIYLLYWEMQASISAVNSMTA